MQDTSLVRPEEVEKLLEAATVGGRIEECHVSEPRKEQELVARCFDLDNLSVLVGTGVSKAIGGCTMVELANRLYGELSAEAGLDESLESWIDQDLKVDKNVETFLDHLYLRKGYFEATGQEDAKTQEVIDGARRSIYDACVFEPSREGLDSLFLFLDTLVSRKSGLARSQLFTLNYDLLLERSADELGLLLNDGFDGSAERWLNTAQFDLDFYYPSGVVGDKPVRCERILSYYKLHGSLNWVKSSNGIAKGQCSSDNMLVYPCQAKYDAMLQEPFAELFRRFSVAIKRPKGALLIVGYGFGDSHVNQLILQALEQPSFLLLVVNPNTKVMDERFPEATRFAAKTRQFEMGFIEFAQRFLPLEEPGLHRSSDRVIEFFKELMKEAHEDT